MSRVGVSCTSGRGLGVPIGTVTAEFDIIIRDTHGVLVRTEMWVMFFSMFRSNLEFETLKRLKC